MSRFAPLDNSSTSEFRSRSLTLLSLFLPFGLYGAPSGTDRSVREEKRREKERKEKGCARKARNGRVRYRTRTSRVNGRFVVHFIEEGRGGAGEGAVGGVGYVLAHVRNCSHLSRKREAEGEEEEARLANGEG